jgi:hypothetical protein
MLMSNLLVFLELKAYNQLLQIMRRNFINQINIQLQLDSAFHTRTTDIQP